MKYYMQFVVVFIVMVAALSPPANADDWIPAECSLFPEATNMSGWNKNSNHFDEWGCGSRVFFDADNFNDSWLFVVGTVDKVEGALISTHMTKLFEASPEQSDFILESCSVLEVRFGVKPIVYTKEMDEALKVLCVVGDIGSRHLLGFTRS